MDGFPIQTNFSSGEVSPLLYGRIDLARYSNGAQRLDNFIVKPQGSAFRRSGTRYVDEVPDSDRVTVLKRFEFSTEQAYVLEFSHEMMRIIKDGGLLLDGSSNVIEVTTPYQESELRELDFTQSADTLYIVHKNHPQAKVLRHSPLVWEYVVMEFEDGPYLDTDTRGYSFSLSNIVDRAVATSTDPEFVIGDVGDFIEITVNGKLVLAEIISFLTDYTVLIEIKENTIDENSFDSRAVLMYRTTNANFPERINSSLAIWNSDAENSYIKVDGVWYKTKKHQIKAQAVDYTGLGGSLVSEDVMEIFDPVAPHAQHPSVKTTTGTITYADREITAVLKTSHAVLDPATDVGRGFRMDLNSSQIWGTIVSIGSAVQAVVELGRMVPFDPKHPDRFISNATTTNWRMGAWYTGNYPTCTTFHEERLVFAATPRQPQTFWMSRSGNYESFAPTDTDSKVLDDSGITFTIASSKVNTIMWLRSGPVLLAGTIGGELQIRANTLNEAITPTNINVTGQTEFGTEINMKAERVGASTLFPQRGGRKIREMLYDFQIDSFVSKDLSIISEHMLRERGKVIAHAYQQEPTSILWLVTDSGQLISVTYEKDQEVVAWTPHVIGGTFQTTNAIVESIAIIPSDDGDVIYLIVKRTIAGNTKRYIEFMEKEFFPADRLSKDDMFFVDAGLSYEGAAVSSVSGLSHLEGETVTVVADGSVRESKVVSAGSIAVSGSAATSIQVGLPFTSILHTLPIEAGSNNGTAQGKIKRVHKVNVRVLHSLGLKHGPALDKLTPHSFRTITGEMDASPDLKSDLVEFLLEQTYNKSGAYFIVQDQPYPLIVSALMPQMETYK